MRRKFCRIWRKHKTQNLLPVRALTFFPHQHVYSVEHPSFHSWSVHEHESPGFRIRSLAFRNRNVHYQIRKCSFGQPKDTGSNRYHTGQDRYHGGVERPPNGILFLAFVLLHEGGSFSVPGLISTLNYEFMIFHTFKVKGAASPNHGL